MLRSINIAFIAENNLAFVRREQMLSSYHILTGIKQVNKITKQEKETAAKVLTMN